MSNLLSITALILTYNEEQHLQRCIDSLNGICSEIIVIDSFSTDGTKEIALIGPGFVSMQTKRGEGTSRCG